MFSMEEKHNIEQIPPDDFYRNLAETFLSLMGVPEYEPAILLLNPEYIYVIEYQAFF